MKSKELLKLTISLVIIQMTVVSTAQAANVDDLEVTIDLIAPGESASAYMIDRIKLPSKAVEKAQANAAGNGKAKQARNNSVGNSMKENRQNSRGVIIENRGNSQKNSDRPGKRGPPE